MLNGKLELWIDVSKKSGDDVSDSNLPILRDALGGLPFGVVSDGL